jgi:hypothetical protein
VVEVDRPGCVKGARTTLEHFDPPPGASDKKGQQLADRSSAQYGYISLTGH